MFHFHQPGERVLCLVTAGNLSVTQALVSILTEQNKDPESPNLLNAANMVEAAQRVGDALRQIYAREGEHFKAHNVAFAASFIFGGQIKGEAPRLFRIYEAGNFIEACNDTPYFQIGETKYGKPILDRLITPETKAAGSGQVRPDFLRFHHALEHLRRPAHRLFLLSPRLPGRQLSPPPGGE